MTENETVPLHDIEVDVIWDDIANLRSMNYADLQIKVTPDYFRRLQAWVIEKRPELVGASPARLFGCDVVIVYPMLGEYTVRPKFPFVKAPRRIMGQLNLSEEFEVQEFDDHQIMITSKRDLSQFLHLSLEESKNLRLFLDTAHEGREVEERMRGKK